MKATDKQCSFIKSLLEKIQAVDGELHDNVRVVMLERIRNASNGKTEASRIIQDLLDIINTLPKPQTEQVELSAGFYANGREVIKVQEARNGSGRLYGKRLNHDTGKFEYEPGAQRIVASEGWAKMSKERASEYGHLYGMCMCCGRTLTDETSIEMGIGPICAGKYF